MLESICMLLHGIASADEGVETILSPSAFNGLISMIDSLYGEHARKVVSNHFMKHPTGGYYCPCEDLEEAFRLCLTGRG